MAAARSWVHRVKRACDGTPQFYPRERVKRRNTAASFRGEPLGSRALYRFATRERAREERSPLEKIVRVITLRYARQVYRNF